MKNLLILATSALCLLLAVAVPLPAETDQNVQLVQIPLEGNKELDILSLPENAEGRLTERNKRTIGVLRQLFPELSKKVEQVIEEKVQLILPIILRNVGPLLLRGGLGGLSGGGATTTNNNDDDDDSDDDFDDDSSNTSVREGEDGRKVSISLPTFPPDTDDEDEDEDEDTSASASSSSSSSTSTTETKVDAPKPDENNTIKNDDQTNVSNSDSNEPTTNIQTTTKSTVISTTATTTTTTTTTTSSTPPSLIRTTTPDTTTPFITSTIHAENSPGSTVETSYDQLNPNNDDSFIYNTESDVNQEDNNSNPTTTEYFDFSGRIDIRSGFDDKNGQFNEKQSTSSADNTNIETTNETTVISATELAASGDENQVNEPQFLPTENETQNLVRRRRKIIHQHHIN